MFLKSQGGILNQADIRTLRSFRNLKINNYLHFACASSYSHEQGWVGNTLLNGTVRVK